MTATINWLTEAIVLAVHSRSIRDHGGAAGVRDQAQLETALAKPLNLAVYDKANLFELAAAYMIGIGRGHPFVDGNKRTAFLATYVFLGLNGYELDADEAETAAVTVDAVTGQLPLSDLSRWIERMCRPLEA